MRMKLKNNAIAKTVWREIRGSLGRYLAVLGIIALGSGFFAGLKVTKTAMLQTEQEYIDRNQFFDYRLISTLGWENESVEAVRELKGVKAAEGSVSVDFLAESNGRECAYKALALTEKINGVELNEGRMPERADECVVDGYYLSDMKLGSKICVSDGNDQETLDMLACDNYTVVGKVRSPLYINFERGTCSIGNGSLDAFIYLPKDGFSADFYTEIYVTLSNTGRIYSEEYDAALSEMDEPVSRAAKEAAQERYARIFSEAEKQLQDAEKEWQKGFDNYTAGYNEYLDGEREYDDGVKKLENSRAEFQNMISSAEHEIEAGEKELAEKEKLLLEGEAELNKKLPDSEAILTDALNNMEKRLHENIDNLTPEQLERADSAIAEARNWLQEKDLSVIRPEWYYRFLDGLDSVEEYLREDEEGNKEAIEAVLSIREATSETFGELIDGIEQLNNGREQLEAGKIKLAKAKEELRTGKESAAWEFLKAEKELEDGRRKLDDAKKELENAKKELDDGEEQLNEAREELADIKDPDVYILGRDTNAGYMCFKNDAEIVEGISRVFPLFFFAVAALVCITTMNRMVDDERSQLGILKALGYSKETIMARYLIYSGSAALFGCIIGVFAGSVIFPKTIWIAYGIMYNMPELTLVFDKGLILTSVLSYLALSLLVTWLTCRRELQECAAELIRPKSPPAGKRIWLEHITFIWKRLSFLRKVSLRNVFRYQKRLIMMVLGIGGCTALLLTGLGLNDSITGIADIQFREVSKYDAEVSFSGPLTKTDEARFLRQAGDSISDCLFLNSTSVNCSCNGATGSVLLRAVKSWDGIDKLIDFHYEDRAVPLPDDGECIISINLAERYGVSEGDELVLTVGDTDAINLRVSGVFFNIIDCYVYTSVDSIYNQLDTPPEIKSALINFSQEGEQHELGAKVSSCSNVVNVSISEDMRLRVNSMLDSMKFVVFLVIGCAGALAFIVLFNLTNINIIERLREIATIKVLGFNSRETSQYVFRENLILSLCGCIAGIPAGIWLLNFVIGQIKIDMIHFDAIISPMSYIGAVVLTFVFTLCVNLFMLPRLEKINMAEALKSVE